MSTTPEDRIVAEFRAAKKLRNHGSEPVSILWMRLARKHKRPIAELKALVNQQKRKEQECDVPSEIRVGAAQTRNKRVAPRTVRVRRSRRS